MSAQTESLSKCETECEFIQMPNTDYQKLIQRLRELEKRQKYIANLSALLEEARQETVFYQSRCDQFEQSLNSTETRLANLVKLQLASNPESKPVGVAAPCVRVTDPQSLPSRPLATVQPEIKTPGVDSKPLLKGISTTEEQLEESSIPNSSSTLINKLSVELLRTKNSLNEALKKKGISMKAFLDAREYETVISQLQSRLSRTEKQLDHSQQLLQAKQCEDVDSLSSNCVEFQRKVAALEKQIGIRNALLNSFQKEYQKLKAQSQIQGSLIDIDKEKPMFSTEERERLEEETRHLVQKVENLQRQLKDQEMSFNIYKQETDGQVSVLNISIQKLKDENEEWQKKYQESNIYRKHLQDQLGGIRSKKDELEIGSLEQRKTINSLTKDLKASRLEKERCQDLYKNMREHYEKLKVGSSDPKSYGTGIRPPCRPVSLVPLRGPPSVLVADGPQSISQKDISRSRHKDIDDNWECSRCLKRFELKEQQQFEKHIAKCIDDD